MIRHGAVLLGTLSIVLGLGSSACRRSEASVDSLVSDADPRFANLKRGERSFAMRCASCHALSVDSTGPSLREISTIYPNSPDGIVRWARAPGKKRVNKSQMPSFASFPEDDLHAIAEYMLWAGQQDAGAH